MYITERTKTRRGYWLISVLLLLTIILAVPAAAAYPKLDNYVGDEAGILSEHTVRTLRKYNETLKKDLGVSISVGTVSTTDGVEIGEYTRKLFEKWNLGDGLLILVAVDDEDFYFVQSKNLEKLITNEDLAEVRDNFLAEDFDAGNIDRGILKTVTRMSSLLVSELQEAAEAEEKESEEGGEKKGTTIGSVIVGIFIFCLCIVLIAVLAFVVLFAAAMFNDECAEFMRTKIFRRGQSRTPTYNYDERLYGNQNGNRRRDPYAQNRQILDQRRSNPNYNPHRTNYGGRLDDEYAAQQQGYAQQNRGYAQQSNNQQRRPQQNRPYGTPNYGTPNYGAQNALPQAQQGRTYYNADGTMRQSRPQQNADQRRNYVQPQTPQQNYRQPQGYAQPQNRQYRQQDPGYGQNYRQPNQAHQQYERQADSDATRAFTIPGRGNN